MVLLLRIATIVKRYDLFNKNITWRDQSHYPVIVIEEPEQNLHPKMQSKLAELFYSLAKDWGCKFLIETHSEYLVRKSQVIVAEEGFADEENLKENNHFKVYYLPSDGLVPYEMKYRIDGKFSNEFGPGFFDTASDLAFELF
jgi:predicted ATPase